MLIQTQLTMCLITSFNSVLKLRKLTKAKLFFSVTFENSYYMKKVKLQDIAIICDHLERGNKLMETLKQSLQKHFALCSVEEHPKCQGEANQDAITVCYSNETASLELPVVIHVRFAQLITCNEVPQYKREKVTRKEDTGKTKGTVSLQLN